MENIEETQKLRPDVNNPGNQDPIVALEALMQIKDSSCGYNPYRSVEKSPSKSSTRLDPLYKLEETFTKANFHQQALPSTTKVNFPQQSATPICNAPIQTGKSWQPSISYSQPITSIQGSSEIRSYKRLPPTPNPLENQVCNIKSAQFLQPIAPKEIMAHSVTVRVAEVEAALRSKPQRGKKRDNLNGMERLELTRTRNREHAKNTRIRKKARYEELVSNETKYFQLRGKQEINNNLINSVVKFVNARAAYMNTFISEQIQSIWHISSGSMQADKNGTECKDKLATSMSLKNIISDDTSCFKFEAMPHLCKSSGDGLVDLNKHDANVVFQVKSKIQKKVALSFTFLVRKDAIAISDRNSAFAEFTLQLQVNSFAGSEDCELFPLRSGIMQYQFAHNSHKIISVNDIVTSDCLPSINTILNGDNCSLGNGTTYPSVVSLDPPCTVQNDES